MKTESSFAGKPLREVGQLLGNLRLLGKSKQSYRTISSVLCFWQEKGLWRRSLQPSQVDFFLPHQFQRGQKLFGVSATIQPPCLKREPGHFTCRAHLAILLSSVRPSGASSAEDGHGCTSPADDEGGDRSDLLCLPPLLTTRGHRCSGLRITSVSSSRNPPKGATQTGPGAPLQLHAQPSVHPASPSISGVPLRYAFSAGAHVNFLNCCTHEANKLHYGTDSLLRVASWPLWLSVGAFCQLS